MKIVYKENKPEFLGFAWAAILPAVGSVFSKIKGSYDAKKQAKAAAAAAKIKAENDAKMLKTGLIVGIPSLALVLILKGKKRK